ncbi:Mobile element protein [Richelia intracellularis]|nr:Mobile element protein [Richelia intracellularis]
MVSLTRRLAPTGFKSSKPKIKSSKNLSIANTTALTEKCHFWCVPISQLQTLHNQDN